MLTTISFTIRGLAPVLQHAGRLSNPLDPVARLMKTVTGKRKKTDSDYERLARLEWLGGLYTEEPLAIESNGDGVKVTGGGRVGFPGENVESMLLSAAKTQKMGKLASAGLFSDGFWPLDYDGPKDVSTLMKDERFTDTRRCKVQQSAVMRTRPIFRSWSMTFDVTFSDDVLNAEQIGELVVIAGKLIGIGDFRPKFGRFEVL